MSDDLEPPSWLPVVPLRPVHGDETVAGASIEDFWRWAFGDLRDNATRGIFAEWIVARLLNIDLPSTRTNYDAFDLIMPNGQRIEIGRASCRERVEISVVAGSL